ncbi:MAG: hypothetical protein JNM28_11450 [Armatimonadetes bacterium]|nr:hypothetical protein [Armatimonadota bacterium]
MLVASVMFFVGQLTFHISGTRDSAVVCISRHSLPSDLPHIRKDLEVYSKEHFWEEKEFFGLGVAFIDRDAIGLTASEDKLILARGCLGDVEQNDFASALARRVASTFGNESLKSLPSNGSLWISIQPNGRLTFADRAGIPGFVRFSTGFPPKSLSIPFQSLRNSRLTSSSTSLSDQYTITAFGSDAETRAKLIQNSVAYITEERLKYSQNLANICSELGTSGNGSFERYEILGNKNMSGAVISELLPELNVPADFAGRSMSGANMIITLEFRIGERSQLVNIIIK